MKTLVTLLSLFAVLMGYQVTAQAATQKTSVDYNYQKKAITVHFFSREGQQYRLINTNSGQYRYLKASKEGSTSISLKFRGYPTFKLQHYSKGNWQKVKTFSAKSYTTPRFVTKTLKTDFVNLGLNREVQVPKHTKITFVFLHKLRRIIQTHNKTKMWIKIETRKTRFSQVPVEYFGMALTKDNAFIVTQKMRNKKTSPIRLIQPQAIESFQPGNE